MFLGGVTTIPQGGSEVFTLDRDQLAVIAGGLGDGYYADKGFWKEVLITFQFSGSDAIAQRNTLSYTDSDTASMTVSGTAMTGAWELRDVTILDYDHGKLVVQRADITNINLYDLSITI